MLMVYAVQYLISKIDKYFSQTWNIAEDTIQDQINSKFPNIAETERTESEEASSSSHQVKVKKNIKDYFRILEEMHKKQKKDFDLKVTEILALTRHILISLKDKAIDTLKQGKPADEELMNDSHETIVEAKRTITLLINQAGTSTDVYIGLLSIGPSIGSIGRILDASEFLPNRFGKFCEEFDMRRQIESGQPGSMRNLSPNDVRNGGYIVSSNIMIAEYVFRNLYKEGLQTNWLDLSKPKRDVILNNALLLLRSKFTSSVEATNAFRNIHKLREEGCAVEPQWKNFLPKFAKNPQRFDRLCLAIHMEAEKEVKKHEGVTVRKHGKCMF